MAGRKNDTNNEGRHFSIIIGALFVMSSFILSGCSSMPSLGGSSGNAVSGSASGESSEGANSKLEHCGKSMGTLAVTEDQGAGWYSNYSHNYPSLGSTVPVLRMMIQQSNCFVIVDRGRAMNNMQQERALMNSGETRSGSNFGKGQMVAADYTMSPSIQFSANDTGGIGATLGSLFGSTVGKLTSGMKSNEAATTLLLTDNRSGVQVSASVGNAKNFDFNLLGSMFGRRGFGSLGGYSKTPEGKVLLAAFVDSYNQMVKSLRNYKAQTVKGGLGKGGSLKVGN